MPYYACLAQHDPLAFRRLCGDHYVERFPKGHRVMGFFRVRAETVREAQELQAGFEASSGPSPFSAEGNFAQEWERLTQNERRTFRAHAYGFPGGSTNPANIDGLGRAAEEITHGSVAEARPVAFILKPYESLPNWPREAELSPALRDLRRISDAYFRYSVTRWYMTGWH